MIVVFGSVAVDLVTNVARIPRPGETILCPGYRLIPGSKGGNQALAARRAGAPAALVATCGSDDMAPIATGILRDSGVDLTHVRSSKAATGLCLIAVDERGENSIVVAAGANLETNVGQLAAVRAGPGDTLVLQNEIPERETFQAIGFARSRGIRTVLNVAPAGPIPVETLRELDILIVNEHEALVVGDAIGLSSDDPEEVARQIHAEHGCTTIVTLGPKGATAFHAGERFAAAAPVVEVVDTTAAGDSFTGAFAAALDRGLPFETALRRGVAAGSLSCTRAGAQTSIPWAAEIDALIAAPPSRACHARSG